MNDNAVNVLIRVNEMLDDIDRLNIVDNDLHNKIVQIREFIAGAAYALGGEIDE